MQGARQCDSQRALAAAERASPSEAALIGAGELLAHAVDHGGRGRMADVAGEGVRAADVGIDADRALVLARNLDDVRQRLLHLVSHRRA